MLTLTARERGAGLAVCTEVVEVPVWRLPLPSGEQLELVVVPGGNATIGSPEGERGRDVYPQIRERCEGVNVEAQRTVQLKPYAMARFPISQAQWAAVARLEVMDRELNATPGSFKPEGLWERYAQPGALPVDSVSWWDCQEWLKRLNRWLLEHWRELGGTGEMPQLALPSESQWEAACRAGSGEPTPFHGGEVIDGSWANYDATYTFGLGREGVFRQRPVTCGAFGLVNRRGLAEMHGQLLEWCGDQWHPDPIGPGWPEDGGTWDEPDPALEGSGQQVYQLLRGGSWFIDPHGCRAAYRNGSRPVKVDADVGVRPCCLLPQGFVLNA
jgi:formylglycine-generating enzyme required for sulfatase activity